MPELLVGMIIGHVIGKKDCTNISHYLSLMLDELRKYMPLNNGIPSHDTYSRLMRLMNQDSVAENIYDWMSLLVPHFDDDHIILDGKASRASAEKNKEEKPPYIINVIQGFSKLFLYHSEVGNKENEIVALPRTIRMLDIRGKVLTIDAIGTQKSIMRLIRKKGGDFVFAVKGNQENLEAEVSDWINTATEGNEECVQKYSKSEKNGGRLEKRTYYFIRTNECINDPEIRSMVKGIGKVERHIEQDILDSDGRVVRTEVTEQTVYYVTSKGMDVRAFAGFVRRHWIVESAHWVYDCLFQEDRSRARKGNARMNTSIMRKVAYNILLFEKKKKPPEISFEYVQDELRFDLAAVFKYFFSSTEEISAG